MDDELLADDGQFKDDISDDLDIDQEAALLGLSDEDEDILEETTNHHQNEQELEYVDEEGNPVEIGENNADLYELAEYEGSEQKFTSTSQDDDVLEVDVDELESFSPEATDTPESSQEPPPPKKPSPKETRYQENLISVPLVQSKDVPKTTETVVQMHDEQHIKAEEIPVSSSFEADIEEVPSSRFELEESEEENVEEDDHRDRFKSERSNIITLTSAKRRTDIPDTLDSVISDEENAKVQAFLAKEQKRKLLRIRNRNIGRGKPFPSINRDQSNMGFPNTHPQQAPFQSAPIPVSTPQPRTPQQTHFQKMPAAATAPRPRIVQQIPYQKVPTVPVSTPQPKIIQPAAPRKILINPHFRGPRPNTTASESSFQQTQVSQISPTSPQVYEQYPSAFSSSSSNSGMYTYEMGHGDGPHVYGETCHPVGQAEHHPPPPFTHQAVVPIPASAPPNYGQPPPPVPFHPSEPPPPLHISTDMGHLHQRLQAPTELWMNPPPNISMPSTQSYSTQPPPVPTYQEPPPPLSSVSMSNFTVPPVSSTFATSSFQNQRVPVSLPVGYRPDQPPPTHQPPPLPHFNPASSTAAHSQQFQPSVSQVAPSVSTQQARFSIPKESPTQNSQQNQRQFSQIQRQNFIRRAQKFGGRQAEKRPANNNIRAPPGKLARIENVQRSANIQVRAVKNSNIREIPLVENIQQIPTINKPLENIVEKREFVDEEDEETRELRMKIEEQKRLREQIMKRKEERRRQMAAQRMEELKLRKRQEQHEGVQQISVTSDDSMMTNPNVTTVNVQPMVNVVQRANEPTKVQQGIPQNRQVVSQARTGSSSMRPSAPQVKPPAFQTGQSAPVKQCAPQVVQSTPQIRQTAPPVRQTTPQIRQTTPQVRQSAPQVRQAIQQIRPIATPVRQASPQVRQASPQVRQASPQVRQASPQVRQASPQVRQASPQVRQSAPQVRPSASPVRPPASPVRPPASPVRPSASPVRPSASPVRQIAPQVRQTTPQVRQSTPQIRPVAPQVRQTTPQVRQSTPQIRPAAPQVRQSTPQIRPAAPQVRQSTPQVRPAVPQVRPAAPQVRPAAPQVRPAAPQVRPAAPQVRPAAPQVRQSAPQVRQGSPQVQEVRQVSPQVRQTSQVKQTAPQIKQTTSEILQPAPPVSQSSPGPNIISTKKKVVVVRKKCDTVAQTVQNQPEEPKKVVSVHDRLGPRPVAKRIKLTKADSTNQQTSVVQNTAPKQLPNQQQKSTMKQPIRPPDTPKQPIRPPETTKNAPVQKIFKLSGQFQTTRQQQLRNQIQRKYFQKRGQLFLKGQGQNQRPWMRNFMKQRMQPPRLQVQRQKSPVAQGQEHMFQNVLPQRMPQNALGQRMPSPRFPGARTPPPPFHMPPFQNQPPPHPHPPSPNNPMQMQRIPYMPYSNNNPPNMPPQGYVNPERMQHADFFYHPPPSENFVPPHPPPPRMPGPGPHPGPNYHPWGHPGGNANVPRPRMPPPPPPVPVMYNERPPFFRQEQRPVPFQKRRFPEPNFQGPRMHGPPRPRFVHQGPIRPNRPPYHAGKGMIPQQRPKMFPSSPSGSVAPANVGSVPPKNVNIPPTPPAKPEGDDKKPAAVSSCPPKVTQNQEPANAISTTPAVTGKSVSQSVVVQNLSASTNEMQIKKLCTGVGPIENIQLMKSERKAIIRFKNSAHASDFQKKYQRYMLDLAMIQVSLLP